METLTEIRQAAMFPVLHPAGQRGRHCKRKFDNQRNGGGLESQGYATICSCQIFSGHKLA